MNINLKLIKSGFDSVREDYTAIVVANGKMAQEDLIAAVNKAEPHISKISAEQVLATQLAFIGMKLAEGNYVNMGGIGLSPKIDGSLIHADEEVTSDMLGIQVNVYDSDYLEAIKSLEVTTSVDEDSLSFNFTKVENSETSDFGTITPGGKFIVIGDKLSQGLDGERIELTDKEGTVKVITDATGDSNGMWLKAKCPTGLAKGKGKIAVYSRGLKTPDGAVSHITRNITILEGSPSDEPRIVSVIGESGADGVVKSFTDMMTITGANVDFTGARFRYVMIGENDAELAATEFDHDADTLEVVSPTTVKFHPEGNYTEEPEDMWYDESYSKAQRIEARLADGTVLTHTIKFVR